MTGIVLVLGDDDANCMHRGWYIGTMTSNGPLAIVGMARNYLRASDLDMERCKDRQRKSTHPGHWKCGENSSWEGDSSHGNNDSFLIFNRPILHATAT